MSIETLRDGKGNVIGEVHNGDNEWGKKTAHEQGQTNFFINWTIARELFNENVQEIGHLSSGDPTDTVSYRYLLNDQGKYIGVVWSKNPKHPRSFRLVFNERGEQIGKIYSENPEHAMSWVYVHDQDGKITHRKYGDGRIKTL